jgi:hypothetical protein
MPAPRGRSRLSGSGALDESLALLDDALAAGRDLAAGSVDRVEDVELLRRFAADFHSNLM